MDKTIVFHNNIEPWGQGYWLSPTILKHSNSSNVWPYEIEIILIYYQIYYK